MVKERHNYRNNQYCFLLQTGSSLQVNVMITDFTELKIAD